MKNPTPPIHVAGTQKGEELVRRKGHEAGRDDSGDPHRGFGCRSARDATGVNSKNRDPIDPGMPRIPPA